MILLAHSGWDLSLKLPFGEICKRKAMDILGLSKLFYSELTFVEQVTFSQIF